MPHRQGGISDGHGTDHLEALTVFDRRHGRSERVPATALFVLIGGEPRTQWLPEAVHRRWDYIVTGRHVAPGTVYQQICLYHFLEKAAPGA